MDISYWLELFCWDHIEETGMSQPSCHWSIRGRMFVVHRGFSSLCSYLGLGLMSARLAILGGVEGKPCKLWVLKSWLWAESALLCCRERGHLSPSHWSEGAWVVCKFLSPWLIVFETNTDGDTSRSQKTWILANLRGCVALKPRLCLEMHYWACGTERSRAGDEGAKIYSLCFSLTCHYFTSAVGEGEELISPCLPPGFKSEWQHAEIVYKIKGQKAGIVLYRSLFLSKPASSKVNYIPSASWKLSVCTLLSNFLDMLLKRFYRCCLSCCGVSVQSVKLLVVMQLELSTLF